MKNEIRDRWLKEKDIYENFGEKIKDEVKLILKDMGISARISSRQKELVSIIKKIIRKHKSYEEIHDKIGIRVVVQFKMFSKVFVQQKFWK